MMSSFFGEGLLWQKKKKSVLLGTSGVADYVAETKFSVESAVGKRNSKNRDWAVSLQMTSYFSSLRLVHVRPIANL